MGLLPTTLTFGDTPLAIIDRHGEPWLSAADLALALGYKPRPATRKGGTKLGHPSQQSTIAQWSEAEVAAPVNKLYNRHADEFTEEMTALVELETPGGRQKVRIFSPRGCYAVGFFARTDRAKAFRRWVLDVLEHHIRGAGPECRLTPLLALTHGRWGQALAPDGYSAVSLNVALVLDHLLTHYADGAWHETSQRQIGIATGMSNASARNALHKLEEWELLRLEVDGRRGSRIRLLTGRIRQALKYARLELPAPTPAMLN
ncbi:MAG: hypothetical protein CVV05_09570 [Gammaproteobacteria bacterium HGW-Gammaproteobacteria-1]|jgi:prophage antirepressor-like protein|nr:MAG: hypothetical protein CVV05_09570 [Gammaproteobacteria bacterium HGW-Gammaproteobacteria-1]